jgi:heme exporter protein C
VGDLVDWDWRLTSTLVVWLIYVSYLMLRRFSSAGETPVMAAVVESLALCASCLFLFYLVFPHLHPQPVIGGGGSMDPQMLHVLLLNWLAFYVLAGWCTGRVSL